MNAQVDFFRGIVACLDNEIKKPDLSGKIKSSIVENQECGGDITIHVRGKPRVEMNFMSQPCIHLGNIADPLEILGPDSAVRVNDNGKRRFGPEELVQEILTFIRGELKHVGGRS